MLQQTKAEPSQMRLLVLFAAVHRTDPTSSNFQTLMADLEREFSEHMAIVRELAALPADAVIVALQCKWSKVAPLLNRPEALGVIVKIQSYLNGKGQEHAG